MLHELDLNLLYVLVALEDKRSVSATAVTLGKSQPSVSASLAKLRGFFNDPLFVRSGNSMQPTPRAAVLIEAARQVLERVGADIVSTPRFDAKTTRQTINIALSDVGEVVFLPAILRDMRRQAPNALVRSISLPAEDVAEGLESGSIDLAVGYFPDLKKSNFFQQALFTDTFASLIRLDHPLTTRKLSIRQYLELEHAVVHAESRTEEVMERYLARKKIHRKVVLSTPHFASAPIIVAQSDLIVTIPEPLARYFARASANLRAIALPFDPPRIQLKQFWHRKFHHDQRNAWLRSRLCMLFQKHE